MPTKNTNTKKADAKKKFWAFKALVDNEGELTIYGEIADSQGGWFSSGDEITPTSFKAELDALGDISVLNVYINSPGGDVFAGQAIYSQLKRHKAMVNMHIDGLAASIASVIAMAGDTIHMPMNAMMMIHQPWSGMMGNAKDFREEADVLDKVSGSIQETYLAKATSMKSKDLIAMLDAETWLTAQECMDLGLCDVLGEEMAIAASVRDFEILAKYKNTPRFIQVKDKEVPGPAIPSAIPPESPTEPPKDEKKASPEGIRNAGRTLSADNEQSIQEARDLLNGVLDQVNQSGSNDALCNLQKALSRLALECEL